jgi:hypothetical protein
MTSLIGNLESAESTLKTTSLLLAKLRKDARAAVDPKMYIAENSKKLISTARKELEKNASERHEILLENYSQAKGKLESYMKPQRTGTENMHFMRAERITRSQTTEEAIATYQRNVSRLSGEERKNLRLIYDDALYEAIARIQPEADFRADQAIDNFRNDVEVHYITGVKIEFEILKQTKELDALINEQIKALENGGEATHYPWAQVVSEISENAKRNVRGPSPMPTLQINPYEEEATTEENSEAAAAVE